MFTDTLELDLGTVEPSLAGPKRPQDRVPLTTRRRCTAKRSRLLERHAGDGRRRSAGDAGGSAGEPAEVADAERRRRRRRCDVEHDGETFTLTHGAVVIAAITSCTNTSNPAVMLAAGLLAQKAVERGLTVEAVGEDEPRARLARSSPITSTRPGLTPYLEQLGFHLVGYGCTTCIGNSRPAARADRQGDRRAATSSSRRCSRGNRNFEGRVNPRCARNYLASPPLVVAYALAGTHGHRPRHRAARHGTRRRAGLPARHLADAAKKSQDDDRARREARDVPRAVRATSSRATSSGRRSTSRSGEPLRVGPRLAPTCKNRRTSTA